MGAQFSGLGVGLPLARTYCWLMGGDLTLSSTPAPPPPRSITGGVMWGERDDGEVEPGGTTARIRIDPHGDTLWVPDVAAIASRDLMEHEV